MVIVNGFENSRRWKELHQHWIEANQRARSTRAFAFKAALTDADKEEQLAEAELWEAVADLRAALVDDFVTGILFSSGE